MRLDAHIRGKVDIKEQIFFLGLMFFVISLFLSIQLNSFSIILLLIIKVWCFIDEKSIYLDNKYRDVFLGFVCLAILYLISFFWSQSTNNFALLIEKKLPFLVFPIIFFINPIILKKRKLNILLLLFSLCTFIACLYSHIKVWMDMVSRNFPYSKWNSWWYTSSNLSNIIDFHPTYLTIYISTALIICFYFAISHSMKWFNRAFLFLIIVYFLTYAILLSSRLNMLFLLLIFIYLTVYFLNQKIRSKLKVIVILFIVLTSIFYTLTKMPYLKSKFTQTVEYLTSDHNMKGENEGNSTSGHLAAWECSLNFIDIPTSLFGYGLGDSQTNLLECYSDNNFRHNFEKKLNAHNEFLQTYISIGLCGLLLLLVIFWNLFKANNFLLNFLCLIFLVSFISESVLSRQKGIVLFTFFVCLFYSHKKLIKQPDSK
jgi:O-antigen ligase